MKVDKYDRQIRLWGPAGQRRLSEARIALIQCTGAGIQALKNLVLPGVGQIDIWDDSNVQVEDLSSTFFFEHSSVGSKKAQQASKNLLQMNPDVKGQYFIKSKKQFLNSPESIKQYNLIIFGGNLSNDEAIQASKKLWELKIPAIFINVIGFFFHIRIQKETHFVESSNTSSKKYYLRLNNPFPALSHYSGKYDYYKLVQEIEGIQNFDDKKQSLRILSNIPYPLILIQVYRNLPQNKRDRNSVKEELNSLKQKVHESYRDNLKEALSRIYDLYQTSDNFMIDISLLDHHLAQNCSQNTNLMIIFLKAAGVFLKKNKCLPQPTILPDMHTATANYIDLKNVYKQQHYRNVKEICEIISEWFPNLEIEEQKISTFIDNLGNLEVVEMRPYHEEINSPETQILNWLNNEKNILLAMRAFDKFKSQNGLPPTSINANKVVQMAQLLKEEYKIEEFNKKFIQEACRSEGKTNININSVAGALSGQEGIKLITSCFTPMNNGYLFDGANGVGYQVKL